MPCKGIATGSLGTRGLPVAGRCVPLSGLASSSGFGRKRVEVADGLPAGAALRRARATGAIGGRPRSCAVSHKSMWALARASKSASSSSSSTPTSSLDIALLLGQARATSVSSGSFPTSSATLSTALPQPATSPCPDAMVENVDEAFSPSSSCPSSTVVPPLAFVLSLAHEPPWKEPWPWQQPRMVIG